MEKKSRSQDRNPIFFIQEETEEAATMIYPLSILSLLLLVLIHLTHGQAPYHGTQSILNTSSFINDTIPLSTREFWMRQANAALAELSSPCPFAAFGSVIVNHTDISEDAKGKLVCIGTNNRTITGNPILHGEIAAINNCTQILTSATGPYNLTGPEALTAFSTLSIYTNAESCPMCASAIRWSNFKEYIFGTTIETLTGQGWSQIDISSTTVFEESTGLGDSTLLIGGVLTEETDPYFAWQHDSTKPCPGGCGRSADGSSCVGV